MSDENKLFLPLFYNTLEITGSLDDAEFGLLVRALLKSRGSKGYLPNLPKHLLLAYNFMLDEAMRVFSLYSTRSGSSYGSKRSSGYSAERFCKEAHTPNFDPDEAFRLAIERSDRSIAEHSKNT